MSKYLADVFLPSRGSLPVIAHVLHLTLVHNQGAAFGFFKGGTTFFVFISFLCIAAIVLLLKDSRLCCKVLGVDAGDKWIRFSLGLILGGACGNLTDRLRFSYVVDFLDFRIWPVFNLADSAVTIGGLLIFWRILRTSSKNQLTIKNEQ